MTDTLIGLMIHLDPVVLCEDKITRIFKNSFKDLDYLQIEKLYSIWIKIGSLNYFRQSFLL
jgi:hypothetical protein